VSDEGDEVQRRRERIGLTISELADRAKVNRDTVSAIEHGKGYRADKLTAIQRALDTIEEEVGLGPIADEPTGRAEPVVLTIDGGRVVMEWPAGDIAGLHEMIRRLRQDDAEKSEG
jgi:transcriptional regulator with XRE-family HTH domain